MSDIQNLYDILINLLKKSSSPLAKQCLADCEGEVAFSPPPPGADGTSPLLLAELYSNNDAEGSSELVVALKNNTHPAIVTWYLDTDTGGYNILTTPGGKELAGIVKTSKTLHQKRADYFLQKDALEKLGESPIYDYETSENTFVNGKLLYS